MHRFIVNVECGIEHAGKFLIIERPQGKHAEGLFSFPGGKFEITDGTNSLDALQQAVKREVFEEVGLTLHDPIHYVTSSYFIDSKIHDHVVDVIFHCVINHVPIELEVSTDEVVDYSWLTYDEIVKADKCPEWLVKYLDDINSSKGKTNGFDCDFSLMLDHSLTLRSLKLKDTSLLFRLVDSNREYLRRFLGFLDMTHSENDTRGFIIRENEKRKRGESLTLSIWYHEGLVGLINLHAIDRLNRSASIGYWLDQHHQGKGIMTQSANALVKYAFEGDMKFHRIEILCAVENERSQVIPKALGFKNEGTLEDAIWHYGNYLDAYVYGLINSDLAKS